MSKKKISERKVLLYTGGMVLFAGVIKMISYSVGSVLFYLAFAPFLVYRLFFIANKRNRSQLDSYRLLILITMIVTLVLNVAGWQEADFFLIFLLMVDYLLVINKRF